MLEDLPPPFSDDVRLGLAHTHTIADHIDAKTSNVNRSSVWFACLNTLHFHGGTQPPGGFSSQIDPQIYSSPLVLFLEQ